MKRSVLCLALALLLLAGCGVVDISVCGPVEAAGSAPMAAGEELADMEQEAAGQAVAEGYAFGELQDLSAGYHYERAFGPAGVYEVMPVNGDAGLMTYMDYGIRAQRVLCGADGCTHDGEGCDAWWPFWQAMLYVADDLLLCHTASSDGVNATGSLWAMEPDGTGRRLLLQMEEGQMANRLFFDGEWLLVSMYTNLCEQGGDGRIYLLDEAWDLIRLNVMTGEAIPFAMPEDVYLVGSYGTQLLVRDNTEWGEEATYSLMDPLTGDRVTVAQTTEYLTQYGEYLVGYRGEQYVDWELYILSLADEGKEQSSVMLDAYFNPGGYFDGVLYCIEMDEYFNESPVRIILETGERQPTQMNRFNSVAFVQVPMAQYENWYVVDMGMRRYVYETNMDYAREDGTADGWQLLYGLVDKDAYMAGSESFSMMQWLEMPA